MHLSSFRTLGAAGRIISFAALSVMTFAAKGWGSAAKSSKTVLNTFNDAGCDSSGTAVFTPVKRKVFGGAEICSRQEREDYE